MIWQRASSVACMWERRAATIMSGSRYYHRWNNKTLSLSSVLLSTSSSSSSSRSFLTLQRRMQQRLTSTSNLSVSMLPGNNNLFMTLAKAESGRRTTDGGGSSGASNSVAAAALVTAAAAAAAAGLQQSWWWGDDRGAIPVVQCESNRRHSNIRKRITVQAVADDDLTSVSEDDKDHLPVYTMEQVAQNNGQDGKPIWMSYGGIVYDVTGFIPNHPGGSEKILMAAGSAIEPFWYLYRQHFASDLPMRLMEHMAIGRLDPQDQDEIEEQMAVLQDSDDDPYANEPYRHKDLRVHSDTPMNAETPAHWLTHSYLTPNSLFYIRHHHPVPNLTEQQIRDFTLEIDVSEYVNSLNEKDGGSQKKKSKKSKTPAPGIRKFTLEELKELPAVTITATLQCSGNRRSGFNAIERTSGTPWGQGAISTATFTGVKLLDLLQMAGLDDAVRAELELGLKHVRFHSIDGMSTSVGISKAANPYGDVIVAYEMNGEAIPRDHGYPLRIVVPGYNAVRSVKWLNKIELARAEAEGPWQRGINYKSLPPGVTDANTVDLDKMPSMMEGSLYSGITRMGPIQFPSATAAATAASAIAVETDSTEPSSSTTGPEADGIERITQTPPTLKEGDQVMVKVGGWAYAGGGRNIVRVDVTGDGGKTWSTMRLTQGSEQLPGRAWAWTFWEGHVPAVVVRDNNSKTKASDGSDNTDSSKDKDGSGGQLVIQLASKSVDSAFNVQPESCQHIWNMRGLGNNSWHRAEIRLQQ